MTDEELIRRGDVLRRIAASEDGAIGAWEIAALPAVTVGVKQLREAFNAGCDYGWDQAKQDERGGPEPLTFDEAFSAFLAALEPVAAPNLKRIGTGIYETQPTPDHAAIREAWEKAYWRMRSYAVHDNDCKLNKPPRFDGPCSCGLTAALEEALADIKGESQDGQ